ncbi:MAG: beta-N-acetylhexosaminidase [Gammaproteobacteria bacterium]|nr:beta-N-acetylhexosaminidase [Gammaproteobacteria bacterium]
MMDVAGCTLTPEDREVLSHPLVGGVILFTRNYESREQLAHLVSEIHALRDPQLIVTVDHEGGPVQRFRDDFTHLPAMAQLGHLYNHNADKALKLATDVGWVLATELRTVGIDHSFTPVLDIEKKGSSVLKGRTFHSDPQVVAELARRLMSGLQQAGMQATGKHFPGHGGVSGDSHEELPVDGRSYEDIYASDILPFERMIHYGLAGIMPAHVVYEQLDPMPAGFSRFWLQEVLRTRLEFTGVIFSDDLSMAGAYVVGGYTERAEAALEAGCDVLLVCNNRDGAIEVLDNVKPKVNPVLQLRIAHMHGRDVDDTGDYQLSDRWNLTRDAIRLLQDEFPQEQELGF